MIVYTCLYGDWIDKLYPVRYPAYPHVCFSDRERELPKGWTLRIVQGHSNDPRRNSRLPKMMPNAFFPNEEYTLYIDARFELNTDPQYWVDTYLKSEDVALFNHPHRTKIEEEAEVIKKMSSVNGKEVDEQIQNYKEKYIFKNEVLRAGGVLLRSSYPQVLLFNSLWWKLYNEGCVRDQISLPIAIRIAGVSSVSIPGNIFKNDLLIHHQR